MELESNKATGFDRMRGNAGGFAVKETKGVLRTDSWTSLSDNDFLMCRESGLVGSALTPSPSPSSALCCTGGLFFISGALIWVNFGATGGGFVCLFEGVELFGIEGGSL